MLGPDVGDERHRRPSDPAERSDLAEAAHPHLRDDDLRIRLEPEEGERETDLVVHAPLGPDRRRVWSA